MQGFKRVDIPLSEVVPTAERMRADGRFLVMIHGYVDKEGKNVISYDYAIDDCIESYNVVGETKLPSISGIYDQAAAWPERELYELMGVEFEGLDTSNRLFLQEDLLAGKGQIIVTPLSELRSKNIDNREDSNQ